MEKQICALFDLVGYYRQFGGGLLSARGCFPLITYSQQDAGSVYKGSTGKVSNAFKHVTDGCSSLSSPEESPEESCYLAALHYADS